MRLDRQRDRQRVGIERGDQGRDECTDDEPDGDADQRQQQRLEKIDGEHQPARGAETFEGGDDLALLRHVALDGVADADAAEQERGQPDEADELGEAVGVAAERRRGIGPVADGEAALRELTLDAAPGGFQSLLVGGTIAGELDAIDPANQAAGLHQPGTRQRLARHQQLRPISETIGEPVGLSAEHAADDDAGLADAELAADVDAEPIEQVALDQHHAGEAPSGAGIRRLKHRDLAIERVGIVDGLHLDQRALAGGGAGHGAEARRFADLAQRIERRALFGVGLAGDQLEGEIAADQQASLPRQCLVE